MEETKKINSEETTATPYDDVHRTMLNDCPKLIIPVVNEMFHKKHSDNEKITVLNNEFFINRQGGSQIERITDTHFLIGSVRYHLECQSSVDGTIMYRIFEYDSQIAMQESLLCQDKLTVKFPNTAILYLRHNQNTPDFMTVEIIVPGASCSYEVPVMKVQTYSIDEIFKKKLFFLLPFHIFVYEKEFQEYDVDEQRLQELAFVYQEVVQRLNSYAESGLIDEYTRLTVIDMSKKVLEHLAKKYSKVREEVGAIMGGKILEYEAKDILSRGERNYLVTLVQKKLAKGDSIEKIADDLVEDINIIEEIIKEL